MSIANGKCLVTKQEGPCLVLPKGSFSPTRITYLSKEGCEQLLEILVESNDSIDGMCVISRVDSKNCIYIPRGVINPKIRFLMSPAAILGMAKDLEIDTAPYETRMKEAKEEPAPAPVEEPPVSVPVEEPPVEEPEEDLPDEAASVEEPVEEEVVEEPVEETDVTETVAIDESAATVEEQVEVSEEVEVEIEDSGEDRRVKSDVPENPEE